MSKGCQQLSANLRAFRSLVAGLSSTSSFVSSFSSRSGGSVRSSNMNSSFSSHHVQRRSYGNATPKGSLVLFRRHANEKKRTSLRGNPTFKRAKTNQRELGTAVFCDLLQRGCDFMRRFERETGHQFSRMGERRSEEKVRKRRRRREMSVPRALKRCDAFNDDDERRRGLLFTIYTLFY